MAYITGALRAKGLEVDIIDAQGDGLNQRWQMEGRDYRGLTPAEIISRVPAGVRAIGLSCMFSGSWPLTRRLLAELKAARPNAILILGGEHATALPEMNLEQSAATIIVTGEGEETAQELFQYIDAQSRLGLKADEMNFSGIRGIVWKDSLGEIHDEGRRERVRAVDDIPLPDWESIPLDSYFAQKACLGTYHGPFMPMLATRGCPYRCTYCSSPNMWTTRWHSRDPEKVVDEMALYAQRYGAGDFQFQDLTAVLKKAWILDFCAAIERRGLKITWQFPVGTRTEVIDEEVAQAMGKAGCVHFVMPFESGDAEILERVKKHAKTAKQVQAAKLAMAAGMKLSGFMMVGFPFETWKSIWKSYLLILKAAWMGLGIVHVNPFMPLPGTEEFRRLRAENKLEVNDEYFDNIFNWQSLGKQHSYSGVMSNWALRFFVVFAYFSFFMVSWFRRPSRLWLEIVGVLGMSPEKGRISKAILGQKALLQIKNIPLGELLSLNSGGSESPKVIGVGS